MRGESEGILASLGIGRRPRPRRQAWLIQPLATFIALRTFMLSAQAGPLDHWTWRNPLPQGNTLHAVVYGNREFMAVGDLGTILTSEDGISWLSGNAGTTNALFGVAYGHGEFVAVGNSGSILMCPDGKNWSRHDAGTTNMLYAVAYGNNRFVAVGGSGTILTSSDGVSWSQRNSGTSNLLGSVAYGNSDFIAIGVGSFLDSPDGLSWKDANAGSSTPLGGICVAFGNQRFVIARETLFGAGFITLPRGDWTNYRVRIGRIYISAMAYGDNQFLAVGRRDPYGDGIILTSPDATVWTNRPSQSLNPFLGIAYGNGRFVAVGQAGTILTSPGGVTWTNRTSVTTEALAAAAYGHNQFVAVGGTILTSHDGVAWTNRTRGSSGYLNDIAYAGNQFVAVGRSGTILTSSTGVAWTNCNSGTRNNLDGIAYGTNQFVTVGDSGTILASDDGLAWTAREPATDADLDDVAYGNGRFVSVGYNNHTNSTVFLTSPDGITWAYHNQGPQFGPGYQWIAYGNKTFVALGPSVPSITSTDGVSWTAHSPPIALTRGTFFYALAYCGSQFVTFAQPPWTQETLIVTSTGGVNWTPHALGTGNPFFGVTYGSGHFLAVGKGGSILESQPLVGPRRPFLEPVTFMPERGVQVTLTGQAGQTYDIQSSIDLSHWLSLTNLTLTNGLGRFSDGQAANASRRFYRAVSR